MNTELEGLITSLLILVSCSGENGCPVDQVVDAIRKSFLLTKKTSTSSLKSEGLRDALPWADHAASTLWRWLVGRHDVTIKPRGTWDPLSLDQVLTIIEQRGNTREADNAPDGSPHSQPANAPSGQCRLRLHASEELMWECIAGHPRDYKRLPKSEWLLLLGIASSRDDGILQGDLGRLTDQDKRSVPKRTDALTTKGYVVKRVVLVRGTRTSKLWLRGFAPVQVEFEEDEEHDGPALVFSREMLVETLDAVPWHSRWTREAIDFKSLALTILAITKEWNVMRISDLKMKLGVSGSRWHQKAVAGLLRRLAEVGVVQYIAAQLHARVFKDCIRYVKEVSPEDWPHVLKAKATATKDPRVREPEVAGEGEEAQDDTFPIGHHTSHDKALSTPPWTVDKPFIGTITKTMSAWGAPGATNAAIATFTLGPTFKRYVSSTTMALTEHLLQPPHLQHLQMKKQWTQSRSVGFFELSVPEGTSTAPKHSDFGVPPGTAHSSLSLAEVCDIRPKGQGKRGRARKKIMPRPFYLSSKADEAGRAEHDQDKSTSPDRFIITLKISPSALRALDEGEREAALSVKTKASDDGDLAAVGQTEAVEKKDVQEPAPADNEAEVSGCEGGIQEVDQPLVDPSDEIDDEQSIDHSRDSGGDPDACRGVTAGRSNGRGRGQGRGRWRGRGRGRGRGRAGGPTPENQTQQPEPELWTCEKCGGTWRTENGLQYHLQKSRSACNPSWIPGPKLLPPVSAVATGSGRQMRPRLARRQEEDDQSESQTSPTRQRTTSSRKEATSLTSSRTSDRPYSLGTFNAPKPGSLKPPPRSKSSVSSAKITEVPQGDELPLATPKSRKRRRAWTDGDAGLPMVSVERLRPELYYPTDELDKVNLGQVEATLPIVHPQTPMSTPEDGGRSSSVSAEPQTSSNSRMRDMVTSILQDQNGSIVGGDELLRKLSEDWVVRYSEAKAPSLRSCKVNLNKLIRAKLFAEHWHGFCLPNGKYRRCQVISLPDREAFSPEVLAVVNEFKNSEMREYEASRSSAVEDEPAFPSRRALPSELVTLDAPLYASLASSRSQQDIDIDEERASRLSKFSARVSRSRGSRRGWGSRTENRYRWASNPERGTRFEAALAEAPMPANSSPFAIRFLEPNKHLEEHPNLGEEADQWLEMGIPVNDYWGQRATSFRLVDPTVVIGRFGVWPGLVLPVFEEHSESVTMNGWMPNLVWFQVWGEFHSELEKQLKGLRYSLGYKYRDEPSPYIMFQERLAACFDVEREWARRFRKAARCEAGPHLLFIQFPMLENPVPSTYDLLEWPGDEQLTLASGPRILEEAAALPKSTSDDEEDSDVPIDVGQDLTRRHGPRAKRRTRVKRIRLRVRHLTAYRSDEEEFDEPDVGSLEDSPYSVDELMAAFVMVRVMLGGTEKFIDWALLRQLFPDLSLIAMRKFWLDTRKPWRVQYENLTREFQDRVIGALEREEIPMINYNDITGYDWKGLLAWTLRIPGSEQVDVPATRKELDASFERYEVRRLDEDWRARFFDAQSSVYSRFVDAATNPAAKGLDDGHADPEKPISVTEIDAVKSWIRSLCCTVQDSHAVEKVRGRFLTLFGGESPRSNHLMGEAIDQLAKARVITRDKRPGLGWRPYRLHDCVESALSKTAYGDKYKESGFFKLALDQSFRDQGYFLLPHDIKDGATMALINLNASGRINLVPHGVPDIPYGFEPGRYEIRKLPKESYKFDIHVIPTQSYLYNEQIDQLRAATEASLPAGSGQGEMPQWIDFFGHPLPTRWADILGAVCFAYSTRGSLSLEGIMTTLTPVLEEYEVPLIMSWGLQTGVLKRMTRGGGMTVGEWWWLAVAQLHISAAADA